jgi:hypothetical protein
MQGERFVARAIPKVTVFSGDSFQVTLMAIST